MKPKEVFEALLPIEFNCKTNYIEMYKSSLYDLWFPLRSVVNWGLCFSLTDE